MFRTKVFRIKVLVGIWTLLATASTGALTGQEIRTIPLDDLGLSSIRSAIWVEERSAVVLADSIGGRVMEVALSRSGVPRKSFSRAQLRPAMIGAVATGYVQLTSDSGFDTLQEIHWFDRSFTRTGVTRLIRPKHIGDTVRGPSKNSILALYTWTVVAGSRIFAYGLLDSGLDSHPYKYGFFTYRLRSPESKAVIPGANLVETFEDLHYYVLLLPYVVARGHEVYYLEMGAYPALKFYDMEEGGSAVYLDGLPGEDELLPWVDATRPTDELFRTIEVLPMPAGLYADGGFLYLLRRYPEEDGTTRWTLTQLRPEPYDWAVRDLGTVRLRTGAAHLTVLFTPRSVLVFEKSSIREGTRAQDVMAMQVIPKAWVADPGRSPLREE